MQPNKKREFVRITSNFSVDEKAMLGKGQFGTVCVGLKSDERKEVAVKIITEDMLAQFGKYFQRQIQILQKLKEFYHPNIVRYYGFEKKNQFVYLFFELCQGNLKEKLAEGLLIEDTVKCYFRDIMAGLVEIHSKNVIHRDLKPENILFDSNGMLKLTDFGLSRQVNFDGVLKLTMKVGNYAYHAPQIYQSGTYDERSDVWSAGLILYQMLTGALCRDYAINSEIDIDRRNNDLRKGKLNLCFEGKEPIWEDLLKKMLSYDYKKRPTSKEVLEEFEAWCTLPLFTPFKVSETEKITKIAPFAEKAKPKKNQLYPIIKTSFFDYLQYLDYYLDLNKFSGLYQEKLINLVLQNSNLALKYPNFFIKCVRFLINAMAFLRCKIVLNQMQSNTKFIIQNEDQNQLITIKSDKYLKIVEECQENLKKTVKGTKGLLSYRQRKELERFEKVFQFIAQISANFNLITFESVDKALEQLFIGIKFKMPLTQLQNINDAEVKVLFLLMKLKEMAMRLKGDFQKMTFQDKKTLNDDLKGLDINYIRQCMCEQ